DNPIAAGRDQVRRLHVVLARIFHIRSAGSRAALSMQHSLVFPGGCSQLHLGRNRSLSGKGWAIQLLKESSCPLGAFFALTAKNAGLGASWRRESVRLQSLKIPNLWFAGSCGI